MDSITTNEILGEGGPNPSNAAFEAKIRKSYFSWAAGYLVPQGKANVVKWSNQKGTKSEYFSDEAMIRLQMVSQSTHPLENITDVVFHQALVLESTMSRLKVNMGAQIMEECQYFYSWEGSVRDLFLPSLIMDLCNQVGVPQANHDFWKE